MSESSARPGGSPSSGGGGANASYVREEESWHVSGVSLYILAGSRMAVPPKGASAQSRFWIQPRQIDDRILYQASLPITSDNGKRIEPKPCALEDLQNLLDEMFKAIVDAYPPWSSDAPQYIIVQVETLLAPKAWENRQKQRATRVHPQPPSWQDERVGNVVAPFMRGLLDHFDKRPGQAPRGYFRHYDHETEQVGYLAVAGSAAVLGGLSDEAFQTFITLLRTGEIAPDGGLTPASLPSTLATIAQWSTNQDVQRTVDQVRDLRQSGDDSARGQIWMAFSLAVIGIMLSLITYTSQPILVAPGLGFFLGGAVLLFASYVRTPTRGRLLAGKFFFWAGTAVAIVGWGLGVVGLIPASALPERPGMATPTATLTPAAPAVVTPTSGVAP